MTRPHKLTPRTLPAVVAAILLLDPETQREVCSRWDAALDELADGDVFGTEKQCDPRGDRR